MQDPWQRAPRPAGVLSTDASEVTPPQTLLHAWASRVHGCTRDLSCLTLCDPMDCSLPGSSVHGTLQARVLEWVAMPSCVSFFESALADRFFTASRTWEVHTCIHSPPNSTPSRLPHNIEQSSMYCTVEPCWLSILNITVYTCPSQTP